MTDLEIAARYCAILNLVPGDEKHIDGVLKEDAARITEFKDAEHFGDCTKAPISCLRCEADEAFGMVPIIRIMFSLNEKAK